MVPGPRHADKTFTSLRPTPRPDLSGDQPIRFLDTHAAPPPANARTVGGTSPPPTASGTAGSSPRGPCWPTHEHGPPAEGGAPAGATPWRNDERPTIRFHQRHIRRPTDLGFSPGQ